jgi:hypothetical protein
MRKTTMVVMLLNGSVWASLSTAGAHFDSGNELYKHCTSNEPFFKGPCLGLISGYFDELHLTYKCKGESGEITRGHRDVVIQRLRDQPAARHLPAFVIASAAYVSAFDCEESDAPASTGTKRIR